MDLTKTAFGVWSGGRYMHYGRKLDEPEFHDLIRKAYDDGIRTFVTADVYGEGDGDTQLGKALADKDRDSWCLVGMIGHDFYKGRRQGPKGFPRFTDPGLRGEGEWSEYVHMAVDRSLERLGTDRFDCLMLHNPDHEGYTHDRVWEALAEVKERGRASMLGVAPGPANGFTLDLLASFEKFGELIDWSMIILSPMEPWPGGLVLECARKHEVKVLTRVVDFGGIFFDDVKPEHEFAAMDHRTYRPAGWIEAGCEKLEKMRPIAQRRDLTMFHLACQWNLAQTAVEAVVPSLIQEVGEGARAIADKVAELASLPEENRLTGEERAELARIGDNTGCMSLRGASTQYQGLPQADQWGMDEATWEVADRWDIQPDRDLYYKDDPRDLREKGMARRGAPQAMDRRLYVRLLVYRGASADQVEAAKAAVQGSELDAVLYVDSADPSALGVLLLSEDPATFTTGDRRLLATQPFADLALDPHMTMFGRTYGLGYEPDLEEFLLKRPVQRALDEANSWAVWYPLRRTGEFYQLPGPEQGKILREHGMIGRRYGGAGYAADIRLECYAMDRNDNEFVIGLVGPRLDWLSKLVKDMRPTTQTAKYLASIGPFFIGQAVARSSR